MQIDVRLRLPLRHMMRELEIGEARRDCIVIDGSRIHRRCIGSEGAYLAEVAAGGNNEFEGEARAPYGQSERDEMGQEIIEKVSTFGSDFILFGSNLRMDYSSLNMCQR